MCSCNELDRQFNSEMECDAIIGECADDILRMAIACARKHDSCFVLSLLRAAIHRLGWRLNEDEFTHDELVEAGFTHAEASEDFLDGLIHEASSGEFLVPATLEEEDDEVMAFEFRDAAMAYLKVALDNAVTRRTLKDIWEGK